MVGEVLCYGRLLNIGETGKDIYSHPASKSLENMVGFDAATKPRPSGWDAARLTRVRLKELESKLNAMSDDRVIADLRDAKTKEEEDDMVCEATATGTITLLGWLFNHQSVLSKYIVRVIECMFPFYFMHPQASDLLLDRLTPPPPRIAMWTHSLRA